MHEWIWHTVFYNRLTKNINKFSDDCENSILANRGTQNDVVLEEKSQLFSVYPNPANSKVTIAGGQLKAIGITDIIGKILIKQTVIDGEKIAIDISKLNAGIYIMQILKADGTVIKQKLVKQ